MKSVSPLIALSTLPSLEGVGEGKRRPPHPKSAPMGEGVGGEGALCWCFRLATFRRLMLAKAMLRYVSALQPDSY